MTFVDGFDGFCDEAGLLSNHLSRSLDRYRRPDYLHLNWKGVAKLGVLIRNTVLLGMNGGMDRRNRSRMVDQRSYRDVAEGRRGGTAAAAENSRPDHDGYQST